MKQLLLSVTLICAGFTYAQESHSTTAEPSSLFVSIRPADGKPAVFPTQQELDEKIEDKIDKIKQLILENQHDPVVLERLKQDLWRFENAVVQEPR